MAFDLDREARAERLFGLRGQRMRVPWLAPDYTPRCRRSASLAGRHGLVERRVLGVVIEELRGSSGALLGLEVQVVFDVATSPWRCRNRPALTATDSNAPLRRDRSTVDADKFS